MQYGSFHNNNKKDKVAIHTPAIKKCYLHCDTLLSHLRLYQTYFVNCIPVGNLYTMHIAAHTISNNVATVRIDGLHTTTL